MQRDIWKQRKCNHVGRPIDFIPTYAKIEAIGVTVGVGVSVLFHSLSQLVVLLTDA